MKKLLLLLTLTATFLFPASFDCKNAKTDIEKLICSDKKLINYQKEIEREYQLIDNYFIKVHVNKNQYLKESYSFWQKQRDECKTKECLIKFYEKNNLFVGDARWTAKQIDENFERKFFDSPMRIYEWHKDIPGSEESDIKLCKNIFNDFANNFDNITIIKPIIQVVSRDDEKLKKALGSCYKATANLTAEPFYVGVSPLDNYFSLWSVDIDKDGITELVISQNDYIWQLFDTKKCEVSLKKPKFDPNKDNVSVAVDYIKNSGQNYPMSARILVEYDNKISILGIYANWYSGSGGMSLETLSKDIKYEKSSQNQGAGSYQLFYNTCMAYFYKNK
jgi:hypothetical protein